MTIQISKKDKNTVVKNKPINTVSQCRMPVFAPIYFAQKCRHPKKIREEKIITPWGTLKIKGELTQLHRDMLDWIFAKAQKHEKYKSAFLFSPRQMARDLGIYIKNGNYCKFFKEKFENMRTARVTIETDQMIVYCGLIREHGYSKHKLNDAASSGKKVFNDKFYYVLFEPKYITFINNDIAMCYLPLVDDILQIKSPVVKAFVRFIISHKDLKMSLNKIMEAIGIVGISKRKYVEKKKEIISQKELLYQKFGITIDEEEIVSYTQKTPDVYFSVPKLPDGKTIEIIQPENNKPK